MAHTSFRWVPGGFQVMHGAGLTLHVDNLFSRRFVFRGSHASSKFHYSIVNPLAVDGNQVGIFWEGSASTVARPCIDLSRVSITRP